MTTIRRINVSQIDGNDANVNDTDEIRPFGETAFYLDTDRNPSALALMMFDGLRTHRRSKILRPGIFYGSNEDSSDGNGYDTIKLIPDSVLDFDSEYTNDQYIIIEPTAGEPGHVHIRSGGTIDNSTADLFLGGEQTHVKVSDTSDDVVIRTSIVGEGVISKDWVFDNNGDLTVPNYINFKDGSFIGDEGGAATPVFRIDAAAGQGISLTSDVGEGNGNYQWLFSANGNITLPQGGIIEETTVGINPTIVIKPADADSPNQALYVKGGLPPEPVDYHLHLTTGDLTDTSIIVGTDDHNIRTTIDGSIELNSYNYGTSVQHTLTFGIDGELTTPGDIEVAGILKIDNGVHEKFQTKVDATGTITHDCSAGHIFYHTSPDANWTANFTNLDLNSTYATAITLVIVQGGTGYYPNALEIGGVSQTINWQGNATPTPSINRVDVVTFSILNNSGTYTVLGQLTGF